MLFLFYRAKTYDSLNGLLLVICGIIAMALKGFNLSIFKDNFWISALYLACFTLFMVALLFMIGVRDRKPIWFMGLTFALYVPFGIIQEILFQYIFLDTLYSMLPNPYICIFLSAAYYMLFHPKLELGFFTFIAGLGWSYLYLAFHNVFWIGISHALLGSAYYVFMIKGSSLKNKLGILQRKKYVFRNYSI
jgi:hypothetical protein